MCKGSTSPDPKGHRRRPAGSACPQFEQKVGLPPDVQAELDRLNKEDEDMRDHYQRVFPPTKTEFQRAIEEKSKAREEALQLDLELIGLKRHYGKPNSYEVVVTPPEVQGDDELLELL